MEACSHTLVPSKVQDHNHSEEMIYNMIRKNKSHTFELNSNFDHKHYLHGVSDNDENFSYTECGTYDFSIVPDGTHDHFHYVGVEK